jgi:hypothetical protein
MLMHIRYADDRVYLRIADAPGPGVYECKYGVDRLRHTPLCPVAFGDGWEISVDSNICVIGPNGVGWVTAVGYVRHLLN